MSIDKGQSDYGRLRPLTYPQTDVFLVCFSIISKSSFKNVKAKWIPEITRYAAGTPFIIVGTKADLRLDEEESNLVSTDEGIALAKELDAPYMECSALTQDGLKDMFDNAMRVAIKKIKNDRRVTNSWHHSCQCKIL